MPTWPHSRAWGYHPRGGVGLILLILRIAVLKQGGEQHEPDKKRGNALACIWLIATGLVQALSVGNSTVNVLLALLAIAAGVLIVLNR